VNQIRNNKANSSVPYTFKVGEGTKNTSQAMPTGKRDLSLGTRQKTHMSQRAIRHTQEDKT